MNELKNLLKVKNKTKVLLNNKYLCNINNEHPFSNFIQDDNNYLSYHSYVIVDIDNITEYSNYATLNIILNFDLDDIYSANICFYDKDNGKVLSIQNIVKFEILI